MNIKTPPEARLGIEDKVRERINQIIKNFGYDEKTISLDKETVRKKLFDIYMGKPESLEEMEKRSDAKYFELQFRKLCEKYPEEYEKAKKLPAMVNIGRLSTQKCIVVFCRADDYYRLRMADIESKIINSDDWSILRMLECLPEEKGSQFNKNYFEIVERVREEFEMEANKRELDKRFITDPIKKEFEELMNWFKRGESDKMKQEFNSLTELVNSKQLNYERSKLIRGLVRDYKRKFGLPKAEVLEEIKDKVRKMLDGVDNVVIPKIEQKYAQVIIAEELR